MLDKLKIGERFNFTIGNLEINCKRTDFKLFNVKLEISFLLVPFFDNSHIEKYIKNNFINYLDKYSDSSFYEISNYKNVPYELLMHIFHLITKSEKGKKIKF